MNDLPALLKDDTWRYCLNSFIRAIGEQPGQVVATPKDARQILIRFFAGDDRLPDEYSPEDITARLFAITNPHTGERLSHNTRKKWEALLTAFYDFAASCTPEGEPLFQQANPVIPDERPEQEAQEETQSLVVVEIAVDENWRQCMSDYLRSIFERSSSKKSLTRYTHELRVFFSGSANGGPPKHPENYTRRDVEWFIHRQCQSRNSGGEPSASTRASRLAVLKSFFKFAADYTIEGPDGRPQRLLQTPPPTLGMYPPKRVYKFKGMSLDQLRAFFAAIDANSNVIVRIRDKAIFMWLLYSLRRRAELCKLTWGDIAKTTIRDEQGNEREALVYSWSGKGDGGNSHLIEVPQPCDELLIDYLTVSGRLADMTNASPLFVGHGPRNGGGVGSRGDTALDPASIYWSFRSYAKKTGMIDLTQISLHSLRHTGIQERLRSGQSIPDTMKVSGHKSLSAFWRYAQTLDVADTGVSLLEKRFNFLEVK